MSLPGSHCIVVNPLPPPRAFPRKEWRLNCEAREVRILDKRIDVPCTPLGFIVRDDSNFFFIRELR
jgi:hypothetical protein